MKFRLRSLVLAAVCAGSLGTTPPAMAADYPFTCNGSPEVEAAFICVALLPNNSVPEVGAPTTILRIPRLCAANVCSGPIILSAPTASLNDGPVVVAFVNGTCIYIFGDLHKETADGDIVGDTAVCP